MGHLAGGKDDANRALAESLSRFPVGVEINDTLMGILKLLYRGDESPAGSKFPIKPRQLAEITGLAGIPEEKLGMILNGMAEMGLLVDIPRKKATYYMRSPVAVGFFEYSLKRADGANLRELPELYERYFGDWKVAEEIFSTDPKIFRALVYERYMPEPVTIFCHRFVPVKENVLNGEFSREKEKQFFIRHQQLNSEPLSPTLI